jgi:hypothetical protein
LIDAWALFKTSPCLGQPTCDRPVENLVTDLHDDTADDVGVDFDLKVNGVAVETGERFLQTSDLRVGKCDSGGHSGDQPRPTTRGDLGVVVDRVFG